MSGTIPGTFLNYAAGILADSKAGLTGSEIVKHTSKWAFDHNVSLPFDSTPFAEMTKKSIALQRNLEAFPPEIQYRVIKHLCDVPSQAERKEVQEVRVKLLSRFSKDYEPEGAGRMSESLVEEAKHWLEVYPKAFKLFVSAEEKYRAGVFTRNVLDDLRLALESLLKEIFANSKPLEKQGEALKQFLTPKGLSSEMRGMLMTLVGYYATYQNTHVKHDDAVVEEEVEIVFEMTASFLKHVVRLHER